MMNKMLLILVLCAFSFCQSSEKQESNGKTAAVSQSSTPDQTQNVNYQDETENTWIPVILEQCISLVSSTEPIEIEDHFNPYYLRLDFDGNKSLDYAVLLRGVNDKQKRGILICKDATKPYFYGTLSGSRAILDNNDDNFITNDWGVLSKEETRAITKDADGKKVGVDAKGESIGFIFEGGGFFIYWDGKAFKGVGGA